MFLISRITRISKIPALYYRKKRLDLYKKSKERSDDEPKPKFSLEELLKSDKIKSRRSSQNYNSTVERKSKKEGTGSNIDLDL